MEQKMSEVPSFIWNLFKLILSHNCFIYLFSHSSISIYQTPIMNCILWQALCQQGNVFLCFLAEEEKKKNMEKQCA